MSARTSRSRSCAKSATARATILRDAGYIAAVQVPEQSIGDGVVHFRVLMAHLTQVRVRGDATGAERIIAGYLNQLTERPGVQPLRRRALSAARKRSSGLHRPADASPRRHRARATSSATSPSSARRPMSTSTSRTAARRSSGRWGALVRGEVFGLTGLGDRTVLSVFSTADFHEQQTLQLGHDFRLGPQGLSIGDTFTYAWAKPVDPDVEGACPHAPEHVRGRLSAGPPPGADDPRYGAAWITSTRT